MIPRKPLASWQQFAQAFGRGETGFAPNAGLRDDQSVLGALLAPQCLGEALGDFADRCLEPLHPRVLCELWGSIDLPVRAGSRKCAVAQEALAHGPPDDGGLSHAWLFQAVARRFCIGASR